MKRISAESYSKDPSRYCLVSGQQEGAPTCPYGNHYQFVGYDTKENIYVRFTKSVFKKLIQQNPK